MNKKNLFLFVLACISLYGCGTGKDSILFVTKTSIAVDLDINPTTFDVGYGRYEGSIAPVQEDGQAFPLLTSISSDGGISSGVFGSGVAQNFGVGNAAIIMSGYLGSDSNPSEGFRNATKADELFTSSASIDGNIEKARRYYFGTKTIFGFTTSFAGESIATALPESIVLGYKRKELAYVPIMSKENDKTKHYIPSMIAASGTSSKAGITKTGFAVSQFYATGLSANYLAAHPIIRNSVISKIIGNDKVSEALDKKIVELDNTREQAKTAKMNVNNKIDLIPDAKLDEALLSLKGFGIAASTDNFEPTDNTPDKKRIRLKQLAQTGEDDARIKKINNWILNYTF